MTRNQSEKKINSILDFVASSTDIELLQACAPSYFLLGGNYGLDSTSKVPGLPPSPDNAQDLYEATLRALEDSKNDRLWFKTQMKLAHLWMQKGDHARTLRIIKELRRACTREDGTEDPAKGTQLLEVTALEIQMYTEQKNNKKLKELYHKAVTVKSAIPHPRIMGIIRRGSWICRSLGNRWRRLGGHAAAHRASMVGT